MTGEGWQAFMTARERPIRGYRAHQAEVEAIEADIDTETAVITPVNILGQAIGGLAVRGSVSPENQALLEAISQQVGQALERSRLAEQTQMALSETEEQAMRLSQLNEMAAAINAAPTLDEVLQVVATRTNEIFKGHRTSMTLLNEKSGMLQLFALEGDIGPSNALLPIAGTAIGVAVSEQRIVVINDLGKSPYVEHEQLYADGLRATMVAPLIATKTLGTLNVGSKVPHVFDPNDENLLLQIASLVASAIESRRLFVQVEERAAELAVLNEVAHVVSQQLELKQLFSAVHEQIQRAILGNAFFVALYNPDDNLIHFPYMYDDGDLYDARPIAADPDLEVTQVIQTGKPIIKNFTEEEREEIAATNKSLLGNQKMPYSMIFVPLRSGTRAIGAISVQIYQPHEYTEADMTLLNGIANHMAVAMENARLFTEAQRRAERERLVNEITRKIQGTTTMKNALQTAVRELGSSLKAKHAQIALSVDQETNGANNGATEERAYDRE
jgi:GAF domain-containing protein